MKGYIEHNIYYKHEDEKNKLKLYGESWTINLSELKSKIRQIKKIVFITDKATYTINTYKAKKQGIIKVYQGEKKLVVPIRFWTIERGLEIPKIAPQKPKNKKPIKQPEKPKKVAPAMAQPSNQPILPPSKKGFRQIIIIGGGKSIGLMIREGLWNQIKGHFTIGCNYSLYHYTPTVLTCVDDKFYLGEDGRIKDHKEDFINRLAKMPLIIAPKGTKVEHHLLPNTLLVPSSVHKYYGLESLKNGVYSPTLTGIFAVTLAINFLRGYGEIFMIGFDWTRRKKEEKGKFIETHYYKDIYHRGSGLTRFYDFHNPDKKWFKPFLSAKGIKIYNVVGIPESNINIFQKINYHEFLNKIKEKPNISQKTLRNYVYQIIKRA